MTTTAEDRKPGWSLLILIGVSITAVALILVAPYVLMRIDPISNLWTGRWGNYGPHLAVALGASLFAGFIAQLVSESIKSADIDSARLSLAAGATLFAWGWLPFVYGFQPETGSLARDGARVAILWIGAFIPALVLSRYLIEQEDSNARHTEFLSCVLLLGICIGLIINWMHGPEAGFGWVVMLVLVVGAVTLALMAIGLLGRTIASLLLPLTGIDRIPGNLLAIGFAWVGIPVWTLISLVTTTPDLAHATQQNGRGQHNSGLATPLPIQASFEIYASNSAMRLTGEDAGGSVYNPNANWELHSMIIIVGPPGTVNNRSSQEISTGIADGTVWRYHVPAEVPPMASRSYGFKSGLDPTRSYEWLVLEAEGQSVSIP